MDVGFNWYSNSTTQEGEVYPVRTSVPWLEKATDVVLVREQDDTQVSIFTFAVCAVGYVDSRCSIQICFHFLCWEWGSTMCMI